MGLQTLYSNDRGTYLFIRKVMALPFLPEEEIQPMFVRLEPQAVGVQLQSFTDYVKSTWIESAVWPPSCWSVYLQAVRTNNDVEGWHFRLSRRASGKSQLPFYLLLQLLHREAQVAALNIRLVSEKKLRRIQRRVYRDLQTRIFSLWEEYGNGERSARRLLKAVSYLNGPVQ